MELVQYLLNEQNKTMTYIDIYRTVKTPDQLAVLFVRDTKAACFFNREKLKDIRDAFRTVTKERGWNYEPLRRCSVS